MLYIDPEVCIDCGACEPACPVQAIFPADLVPEQWKHYTEINADWYKTQTAEFCDRSSHIRAGIVI